MNDKFSISILLNNKWIRLFLVVDIIIIIAVVLFFINDVMKSATIKVDVAPIDATVLINGRKYTDDVFKIYPGIYEVEVSREGLDTKTFTVEAKADSILDLAVFLSSNGNFDFYTLEENYPSFFELSQIASSENNITVDHDASAQEFIGRFQEDYDLYMSNALPINYSEYKATGSGRELVMDITIKKGNDDCVKFLCLDALMLMTNDEEFVNKLLLEKGFRVEDYEIRYRMY